MYGRGPMTTGNNWRTREDELSGPEKIGTVLHAKLHPKGLLPRNKIFLSFHQVASCSPWATIAVQTGHTRCKTPTGNVARRVPAIRRG